MMQVEMQNDDPQAAIRAYYGPMLTGEEVDDPFTRRIPVMHLQHFWPILEPQVARIVEANEPNWTMGTVVDSLLKDEWQLWAVWGRGIEAVVLTEIYHEASGFKAARTVSVAGAGVKRWAHLVSDLEDWARAEGAGRFDMIIAKGLARQFPDYKLTHVVLEKDLTNGEV